jgi:Rod binding domain-containing protein
MSDIAISPMPLMPAAPGGALPATPASSTAAAVEKAAKSFESVLLERLMEEMQRTVPDDGLLDSPAVAQSQSMMWMFLSQDIAANGGIGLWKDLARQFAPAAKPAVEAAK